MTDTLAPHRRGFPGAATLGAAGSANNLPTRRRFLTDLASAGAVGGLAGVGASGLIGASQSLAAELPRAEGFTDIRYLDIPGLDESPAIGRGEVDFSTTEVNWLITPRCRRTSC